MNGWKIFAGILLVILILENIGLFWLVSWSFDIIDRENKCAINICENGGYDSYIYDDYDKICYCYSDGVEGYSYREVIE